MDFALKFKDPKVEKDYLYYSASKTSTKRKTYLYLTISYASIYFTASLISYFITNTPNIKGNTEYIVIRLCSLCVALIFFLPFIIKCIGKTNIITRNSDIILYFVGFCVILAFENPIKHEKSSSHLNYNNGYNLWWTSFEIQFYCLVICCLFKRWISRSLFFATTVIYFCTIKIEVISDIIFAGRAIGITIIYVLLVYNLEKISRESFYELYKLMNKEKLWKEIIDNLLQSVIILKSEKEVVYTNKSMINHIKEHNQFHNKNYYNNDEIIKFLKNFKKIKLRKSIQTLEMQLENSTSQSSLIQKQKFDQNDKSVKSHNDNITDLNDIEFQNIENLEDIIAIYALKLNKNNEKILNESIITFDCFLFTKKIEIQIQHVYFEEKSCILAILTDHTQRDLISKLEQNDKYKNIILSTVSHELRTPINSTKVMLQAAIDDITIPKEPKSTLLEPSLRSLSILASLINDILDYSSIQANKLKLVFQSADIKQIIRDACVLIEMQCKKKNLILAIDIANDIPRSFTTDPNRLTQIILNLLSNALKFTTKGYIRISVQNYSYISKLLKISVEDTGIGIKEKDIPKLFKEFGQLELGTDSKLNPNGCGLGLDIANKLAKSLGPNDSPGIRVKSEYGKGSTFSFIIQDKRILSTEIIKNKTSLQLDIEEEEEDSMIFHEFHGNELPIFKFAQYPERNICYHKSNLFISNIKNKDFEIYNETITNSTERHNIEKNLNDKKILIVDDDIFSLCSVEIILKSLQIPYETANSGHKAIELLHTSRKNNIIYKLIIMDFNMPELDGLQTTRILRQLMDKNKIPKIPIIGCTAYEDELMRKEGLKAGMDGIINKPIRQKTILKLINKNLYIAGHFEKNDIIS